MGQPLNSSFTRVWFIEGRARPDHTPTFLNLLKQMGVDQPFGDETTIWEPDPSKYDGFIPIAEFGGDEDRPSTSLVGHFPSQDKSKILSLAQAKCPFDMQLHIGRCQDPGVYNSFDKIVIWEQVKFTDYSTDDMGALEPGERNKVDETGDISARRFYEFVPLSFAARTPSVVTNELLDVIVCDNPSCGDCETESNGCQRIMAISSAGGGSPSTPADVVFSLDGGRTWLAHDIDTLGIAVSPAAIACVSDQVVVVANANGDEMHIAPIADFNAVDDPAFTQIITGYVAGGEPNDIWSLGAVAYVCGDRGHIYKITNPAAGVTLVDSASTTSDLQAIHMLSEEFGVTVGNDGVIVTISGPTNLANLLATSPVGIGTNINTIFVKNEKEWFIGDNTGALRRTLDDGATWATITLPSITTTITDITMSSDSIMYVSGTVAGKGEIFISTNGGNTFIRAPRALSNAMPNNDSINAIAACFEDVDFIAAVGLHSDGADGFIVMGND